MNRIVNSLKKGGISLAMASIMGVLLVGCGGGNGQPDAPSIGTATAGNAQATVSFTPPVNNGGAAITNYTVISTPGNFTASGGASPITVTGLTNGTAYSFRVTATNIGGTSAPSSPSNSVTPSASAPGAPTIGIATAGNAQASVSFTPPLDNGGTPINYYTVTSTPGNLTAFGAASPITIRGLSNGTTYSFTVTATNSGGTSPASAASNSVSLSGAIAAMPFSGTAAAGSSSAYTYTTLATINTIQITGTVNVQVFTDATYTAADPNWNCVNNCIATTSVPAGTVLYIGVNNFSAAAATYTLNVTNAAVMLSEGAKNAPKVITFPHNGTVGPVVVAGVADSYYKFTTTASTGTITATPISDGIDPVVFTDATFTVIDPKWTCTFNAGLTPDTCTTTPPVPAGTILYIDISYYNLAGAGATFTLH
jgi:hypothetical protein